MARLVTGSMNKILYDFIASSASSRSCLVEILHRNIATISVIIVGFAATASETHKFILHLYSVKESQMCFHISLTYFVAHKFHSSKQLSLIHRYEV